MIHTSTETRGPILTRRAASFVLAGFVLFLVYAVESGATLSLDRALLVSLRQPGDLAQPIGPGWLLGVMRDTTSLGSATVTLLVMVVGALAAALRRRWRPACLLLLAIGGGTGLVNLVKFAVARVRPDVVPHLTTEMTFSFPSSHAAMSVLTYGAIATIVARDLPSLRVFASAVAGGLALTIGVSRLYLGVHYPTDVLAGWMCGLTWLLVCQTLVPHQRQPH